MAHDLHEYFRVEARELSEQMAKAIFDLERSPASPARVAHLLRLAHTLKGAARVVKQREIADGAHAMESLLGRYREGGQALSRVDADQLLQCVDRISKSVETLERAPAPPSAQMPRAAREEGAAILRPDVEEMDTLLEALAEAGAQLAAMRPHLPARLSDAVVLLDREIGAARDSAQRLRLMPARLIFNALERTARDAAAATGKRVAFAAQGGEVRLEASVLGQVQNALVQAARNAVAHGIETEQERRAAGKSGEGSVLIEVERREHSVVFSCRDDGRGVSPEAVRATAIQKGVLPASHGALSEREALDLLLRGGLSTARSVTELAGRGVGLDLVREVATRLGGELKMASSAGSGSTVQLIVPVSLSSFSALIVEVGGQTAAIPLDRVRSAIRVAPHDISHTPEGETLVHEGQVIPFTTLRRALRLPGKDRSARRAHSAVVIGRGAACAAVGVDHLRGTEHVVVRPLPKLLVVDPVVVGATLDGAGTPRPVLDSDVLIELARGGQRGVSEAPFDPGPVLVIDDSLTTRMLEQSILESAGYRVEVASSAEEGLELAQNGRYCLFMVDVEMPGMDGFEFVTLTRADPRLRDIPAILVTSRSSLEDKQRGKSAGAAGYVVKSEFEQNQVLALIGRLVGAP